MKIEIFYYKFLSVIYNLCPSKKLKEKIKIYALKRFPSCENNT